MAAPALAVRRRARDRHAARALVALTALVVTLFAVSLCVGEATYTPVEVLRVLGGGHVAGATFVVERLRLPRAATGLLCGAAFGIAGATFQTLLRNWLASPDVIGITAGANIAAVFGILVLGASGLPLALLAVAGGLATALAVAALAWRRGIAGPRLILVGIGVGAMLGALTSWMLVRGDQWDVQAAMRWLTGSLNGADWDRLGPLAAVALVAVPALLALGGRLDVLRLGDEAARGLGVSADRVRLAAIGVAVLLLSVATATTGPVASVSFLAGPIATRLVRGRSPLAAAALVGAALVLASDLVASHALPQVYPVGVVTGALGGPFLLYLLIRMQARGVAA